MNIGLIFDMDGVIVDNHLFHFKSWQVLCQKYGKPLDETHYREQLNGRTLGEVVKFIFNEPMDEDRVREIGHEKEALYRTLYQPYIKPLSGLLKILSHAERAGIPMVIGTSAPKENVTFTMNGTGIRHYFKHVLDDRAVTNGKPDPEIYLKCAAEINRENDHCVVFEDAVSGLKAGRAAGSKTIALTTSHDQSELDADLIIDDFNQINLEQIVSLIGK